MYYKINPKFMKILVNFEYEHKGGSRHNVIPSKKYRNKYILF